MIPTFSNIRGAIGLYLGLGLEEVIVDYSKFSPGILAICGDNNGVGKSTLLGHSQPFRMEPFRTGKKFEELFYLKDSHKIFRCIHNNDEFEIRILINGETGASEAYLYRTGSQKAMNEDGKKTSFDDAVKEVFGDEDLFLKTAFSKQVVPNPFSKQTKGMDTTDFREMFYTLLSYDKYDLRSGIAKKYREHYEEKYRSAEQEIKIWQEQINNITATKDTLMQTILNRTQRLSSIEEAETFIKNLQIEKQNQEIKLAGLRKEKDEEDGINKKIAELRAAGEKLEEEKLVSINVLNNDLAEKISEFELKNQHLIKIEEFNHQKREAEEKAKLETKKIEQEITELHVSRLETVTSIEAHGKAIERSRTVLANTEKINSTLEEKKRLVEDINKLMIRDKELTEEKAALINQESQLKDKIRITENKLTAKRSELKDLEHLLEIKTGERTQAFDSIASILGENKEILEVTDAKPCDTQMGNVCPVLKYVSERNDNIPQLKTELEQKTVLLKEEIDVLHSKIACIQTEIAELVRIIERQQKEVEEIRFGDKYKKINCEIDGMKPKVQAITSKLAEINKHNWEELKRESDEAANKIKLEENNKANAENILRRVDNSLQEKEQANSNIQQVLTDKVQSIENQIDNEQKSIQKEKESILNDYAQRIKNEENLFNEKLTNLNKQIEELTAKIETDIDLQIGELEKIINQQDKDLIEATNLLRQARLELQEIEGKIGEIKQQIGLKEVNEDKIKSKCAELKFYKREIKEYGLFESAWGRDGIPVLKLENVGPEISETTNGLLAAFDNPFRINLITTEPYKAKKKGAKEVFKIEIVHDEQNIFQNRIVSLDDKCGGEQIAVSTPMQLAILLKAKEQGNDIGTIFLDEKDGGFTDGNAEKYFTMLQEFHKMANVYYTILITHRSVVMDKIQQKIMLTRRNGKTPGKVELIIEN